MNRNNAFLYASFFFSSRFNVYGPDRTLFSLALALLCSSSLFFSRSRYSDIVDAQLSASLIAARLFIDDLLKPLFSFEHRFIGFHFDSMYSFSRFYLSACVAVVVPLRILRLFIFYRLMNVFQIYRHTFFDVCIL